MREQQEMLLPWLFLRNYGLILSHAWHDVAGAGDGTIMVQRGYSLALEDQKVLPLWKELPIYNSIMIDDFDMWYVKGWSYEMIGAFSQKTTSLSLGSIDLLTECSKDHFTHEVLDGKVGDERYREVDGFIYY